jgi:fibro-slime domain-containing protein
MKKIWQKYKQGSAALISSIVVAAVVLSIVLSLMLVVMDSRAGVQSFADSLQSFYSAESGVSESLMRLRKEPNNFTFSDLSIGNVTSTSEFITVAGTCDLPPECVQPSGSGWWGEYFNYLASHPDMEIGPPYPGPTPTPTEHDWYDDIYKTHEQIDVNLNFGPDLDHWFPYDGTEWDDRTGQSPTLLHNYFFGTHWRAKVTAPSSDYYACFLASDDDSWVLRNGIVIVNNSGAHDAFSKNCSIYLSAGDNNIIDIYFAERHTTDSGFNFNFSNTNLIITPWPDGCGENYECNSNIESTASTTRATRKVRYKCNQEIEDCSWEELVP